MDDQEPITQRSPGPETVTLEVERRDLPVLRLGVVSRIRELEKAYGDAQRRLAEFGDWKRAMFPGVKFA